MWKMFLAVMACVALLTGGAAQALPNAPFLATAEMVATVRSVSIGGALMNRDGDYVRDLTLADARLLPWHAGDRLTVRWEQHSDDLLDCEPDSTFFAFGGLTRSTTGSYVGPCYSPDAASFVQLERARGGTSPVWDAWEAYRGRGPYFNMETGQLEPYLDVVDGLVTDCCVYLYDPEADRVVTLESNGAGDPLSPSWPVQSLQAVVFDGASGAGGGVLYSSEMFGITEWEDPQTGEWISLGSIEGGFFSAAFDVVWRSTFQTGQTPVPEPAALALAGAGLLGVSAVRRRRRFAGGMF